MVEMTELKEDLVTEPIKPECAVGEIVVLLITNRMFVEVIEVTTTITYSFGGVTYDHEYSGITVEGKVEKFHGYEIVPFPEAFTEKEQAVLDFIRARAKLHAYFKSTKRFPTKEGIL